MKNSSKLRLLSCFFLLGVHLISYSQNLDEELKAKLSASDRSKLQKSDEQYQKGIKSEEEANNLLKMGSTSADNDKAKAKKKFATKRLEAASLYANSNIAKLEVYRSNIKKFWKQYTGDKHPLKYTQSIESMTNDSLTKASDLRYNANKAESISEKVSLIIQAETIEKRFVQVFEKVLFSYLSYPIEYDQNWLTSSDSNIKSSKQISKTDTTKIINTVKFNKDSIRIITDKETPKDSSQSGKKELLADSIKIQKPTQNTIKVNHPIKNAPADSAKTIKLAISDSIQNIPQIEKPALAKTDTTTITRPITTKDTTISKRNVTKKAAPKKPIVTKTKTVKAKQTSSIPKDTLALKVDSIHKVPQNELLVPKMDSIASTKKVDFRLDSVQKGNDKVVKQITPEISKENRKSQFQSNDSSLYGKIAVSEDQVDVFNDFLKKKYPKNYENYIINFQELDFSDVNSLRNAWYKYLYGYSLEDSAKLIAEAKNLNISTDSVKKRNEYAINNTSEPLGNKKNSPKKLKNTQKNSPVVTNKIDQKNVTVRPSNNLETTEILNPDSGFIFKVQIAACRIPLDEKTLKGIYNGSEKIIELHEDNWYKYAISQYSTYRSARKLRDQISVPGAFVIAYLNGKRIKITPGIAYKHHSIETTSKMANDQVVFRVQIAASKVELSEKVLKNIYSGNIPIDKIIEEGWYKYSLSCGNDFKEALKLLKTCSIPGAFVVAYYNNKKMDMDNAIKLINK